MAKFIQLPTTDAKKTYIINLEHVQKVIWDESTNQVFVHMSKDQPTFTVPRDRSHEIWQFFEGICEATRD